MPPDAATDSEPQGTDRHGHQEQVLPRIRIGATISDGRVMTDEIFDQVVSTFYAETFSPRMNIEHLAGYSPET